MSEEQSWVVGKAVLESESREKIKTLIFEDSRSACGLLAGEVAELVRGRAAEGRNAVLGLATGSTPVPFYRELVRLHKEEGLSFQNVITFNLDEYYGLEPDHPESYHRFMRDQLFDHVDIPSENVHVPSGTVPLEEVYGSCAGYERAIREAGGIDLQILGIGRTGHIGFNEPGSVRDSRTRRLTLDRVTRQDAAADFLGVENVPRFAITMGVGTIMDARRVVLMAWGEAKAEITARAVEGEVTDAISASFLQEHKEARFFIDRAASADLTRVRRPWLVGQVQWTAREARRAVSWLSGRLEKPVLKLIDEDYNENGMADLLTEQGTSYELNIRVFNDLQHTISGWPGGKPDADDTHRPVRATPYPKRVLVFSPEPHDAILGMGATVARLVAHGHDTRIFCQTSGNLRVPDHEAVNFARVLNEIGGEAWGEQVNYAKTLLGNIEAGGGESGEVRHLKGLILRGEVRDAAAACKLDQSRVEFLDLPFYERGRYRRFELTDEDVEAVAEALERHRPDQIFVTGNLADPSSLHYLCYAAVERAFLAAGGDWAGGCTVWAYRGQQKAAEPYEIDMAVPVSPDQMQEKSAAIAKFRSIRGTSEVSPEDRNRTTAAHYDRLGLAEYEAIEEFERLEFGARQAS